MKFCSSLSKGLEWTIPQEAINPGYLEFVLLYWLKRGQNCLETRSQILDPEIMQVTCSPGDKLLELTCEHKQGASNHGSKSKHEAVFKTYVTIPWNRKQMGSGQGPEKGKWGVTTGWVWGFILDDVNVWN